MGCGPGSLAIELADLFEETVALDPDPDMLAEGARRAGDRRIRRVRAVAEAIPRLGLGRFRLATFGQSFYWTDRERVAEAIYGRGRERLPGRPGGQLLDALARTRFSRPGPCSRPAGRTSSRTSRRS